MGLERPEPLASGRRRAIMARLRTPRHAAWDSGSPTHPAQEARIAPAMPTTTMKAAVFDFDGVLVNSEPLHFSSLREALLAEGIEITEQEYVTTLLAYDDRGAIRIALEARGIPPDLHRLETIATRKARLFEALMPGIPLFPGARELVRALAAELPVGIASGARHEEIESILVAARLRDAFEVIVGADDVSRTKPDPEPYLTASRALGRRVPGLRAEDCVAVEDSVAGILSARHAGMRVVAVTHSFPRAKLHLAHHVVDGLEGVSPNSLRGLFAA
jgi:beta-phosphoglucomutase